MLIFGWIQLIEDSNLQHVSQYPSDTRSICKKVLQQFNCCGRYLLTSVSRHAKPSLPASHQRSKLTTWLAAHMRASCKSSRARGNAVFSTARLRNGTTGCTALSLLPFTLPHSHQSSRLGGVVPGALVSGDRGKYFWRAYVAY